MAEAFIPDDGDTGITDPPLPPTWQLRRAWPASLSRPARGLSFELVSASGVVVAADGRGQLMQHDPALPGRAHWGDQPGATVIGHRLGRRAVVRTGDGRFVKLARPLATEVALQRLSAIEALLGAEAEAPLRPTVIGADTSRGELILAPASGEPLTTVVASGGESQAAAIGQCLGSALAAVCSVPDAGRRLPSHTLTDEAAAMRRWSVAALDHAVIRGASADRLRRNLADIVQQLAALPTAAAVATHRDLHEGQVLVSGQGAGCRVTWLDWDTASVADPATDVANLLAHLDLLAANRPALGGRIAALEAALLTSARRQGHPMFALPYVAHRLSVLRAATALRIACVHAFRRVTEAAATSTC